MDQKKLEALQELTEIATNKKKPLSERGMVLMKNGDGGLTVILPGSMKAKGMIKCAEKNQEAIDQFKEDDSQIHLKL